ncbi:MAG: hypothetical protein JSV97_05965 [candidate division WOR-3 bacterium]|nr:MAG: hypothetical protein JSV97_05965 [candidate division WOR-3 bacterium]
MVEEKNKQPLVGIILGKAITPDKAESIADFFNKCPYCATCTNVVSAIIGVLTIPQDHRWWLDSIPQHPKETVGLEAAEVFYVDKITVSSPWSSGSVKPELKQPPCGADCQGCPMYQRECKGCPTTIYYLCSAPS